MRTNSVKVAPLFLLSSCFFLSGLAGLIYQTAWSQQLALVFGTSEQAVVAVLAAYLGGLALGATLAGRWVRRVRRPILVYGVLELGIGAAAMAVPTAMRVAGWLHAAVLGGGDLPTDTASVSSAVFYLATSFVILLVPTALMGATLPLLARHAVRREADIGPRISLLYTANTAGAAAGSLATAFLLLPRLGLGWTIAVGAGVNVIVFLGAALLARGRSLPVEWSQTRATPTESGSGTPWILPLILISGAVSFTWEILWTRLLTPLLGGTVYAFAVMLASFLIALALGSALAAPLTTSAERARRGFAGAQIAIAALSLAAFAAVDRLPLWIQDRAADGATAIGGPLSHTVLGSQLLSGSLASALLLLPSAMAIGATFPLAVRVLSRSAEDAAAASARVFAWNTVGAIAGALIAGYLALPSLQFAGTATAAAATSLLLAAASAWLIKPHRPAFSVAALAGLLLLAVTRPATPWRVLRHSSLTAQAMPGQVVHLGVGRSATVLLVEQHASWRLVSNGLPESSIDSAAQRPERHIVARWLSLLPLAVRPETRSLLVVGLGAGVTVEEVPASVETLRVVELEPEVVRANRKVAHLRRRDPLADPRLRLHIGDARGALRLTDQRFNAIVSQPSHPWTAASSLYTREFFSLVRERLTPGGVFVQWMAFHFVDETLLRALLATAADVFSYVELYQPLPDAILVLASAQPLAVTSTASRALFAGRREWAKAGVTCLEDILTARVLDNDDVHRFLRGEGKAGMAAAETPFITDSRNLFRMRSPAMLKQPLLAAGADRLLADFEPLLAATEAQPSQSIDTSPVDTPHPDTVYLVRRLIRQGAGRRARRLAETLSRAERQTAIGLIEIAAGRRRQGEAALQEALRLAPDHSEALAAQLGLYQSAIAAGQPVAATQRGGPDLQAVIEGWRLAGAGDWRGVRRLDDRFASLDPRHPLFAAATRLRVRWRIDSGEADLASQALGLLAPLLAPLPAPPDLLLRAKAGAAAGKPGIALTAVGEGLSLLRGRVSKKALLGEAQRILRSLPEDPALETWQQQLLRLAEAMQ